jgi:RNA polymerase-binding transcription factor DksA
MAKKNDKNKKAKPANKASKPVAKKAAKPAPKKLAKPAKKAPAKPAKKVVKPAAKKVVKPAPKKAAKPEKKIAKPAPKKAEVKKTAKQDKEIKKPVGKPIDAIAKKGAGKKADKVKGKKKGKGGDDDDEEEGDVSEEEEDDSDVDVKDDYEKTEDEDVLEGDLDEAGLVDLDGGSAPEPDDDDDEIPEKRGRGRRKKNEGKSSGNSMEAYIRNRPLQIDISKPLIKKSGEAAPKPFVNTKDNRSRYTDKELAEFKELILEKLKEAQADYDLLKQTLSNEDNHGTDDTSPTFKLLEDGSDVMSKEETAQLAARQEKHIINLKNALVRIENKTYGICRVTGKLIPKERLRSVPHATLGIDAKLNQNN